MLLAGPARALAHHQSERQRGHPRVGFHHGAAGKIQHPRRANQPSGENTQCANGTYTINTHNAANTTNPVSRMRSAPAPVSRAVVMTANISWNATIAAVGTCCSARPGTSCVGCPKPKKCSVPSSPCPPASGPNARDQPTSAHTTVTTAIVAIVCNSIASTFLLRTMPP